MRPPRGSSRQFSGVPRRFRRSEFEMGDGMARAVPYDPRLRKEHTLRAEKTLKKYLRTKEKPREIFVEGKCPRCGHDIHHTHRLTIAAPMAPLPEDGADRVPPLDVAFDQEFATGDVEFSVRCNCEVSHPKTPEGKKGCGSGFKVHVKW